VIRTKWNVIVKVEPGGVIRIFTEKSKVMFRNMKTCIC